MTNVRERDAHFAEIIDRIADAFERAMRAEPARPTVTAPTAEARLHRVPLATRARPIPLFSPRRRFVTLEW